MLTSLALLFLAGLAMAVLCSLLRLPRIIGMLFTGILLGPYVLGLLDPSILAISAGLKDLDLNELMKDAKKTAPEEKKE